MLIALCTRCARVSLASALAVILGMALASPVPVTAAIVGRAGPMPEHISGGGFELGLVNLQVHRFPRYFRIGDNPAPAKLDDRTPLDGAYSLYLPALPQGGYRITPQVMSLVPGRRYRMAVLTRSYAPVDLTLQAYTRRGRVFSKTVRISPGEHQTREEFRAAPGHTDPYIVYFWFSSKGAIRVDDLSLRGPFAVGRGSWRPRLWMEPETDHLLGVYAAGVHSRFVLRGRGPVPAAVRFRISDPLSHAEVGHGTVAAMALGHGIWKADIILATAARGYYRVWAVVTSGKDAAVATATRSYAVITPNSGSSPNRDLFGLCMEEHGLRTFINAFLRPRDLYGLARDMGVGSVRIFSLLMPDLISRHGHPYDFSQADGALRRIEIDGLSPMFELGSNTPYRIPAWLRSRRLKPIISFDLLAGIGPRPLRELVAGQRRGDYFRLNAYRRYLDAVFRHFSDRIPYYEVWNEPAWKFTVPDFLKIVRLTRSAQRRFAPTARLVGFSSTIGDRDGEFAPSPRRPPSFLRAMAAAGALGDTDVLSYHGAHAFQFFGRGYDRRNLQTGFVARMRRVLKAHGRAAMPIWDTEFGIPWTDPQSHLEDFRAHRRLIGGNYKTVRSWDVARQLPMIYAAAISSDVRRVFWFGMAQSLPTIAYPGRMWGLFDPNWQPMPQIPVYNAMTVLLGHARYRQTVSDGGGDRAYVFRMPAGSLILAYNWKGRGGQLRLRAPAGAIRVLNVMGHPEPGVVAAGAVTLGAWPIYVQVQGVSPGSLDIRVGS